MTKKDELKNRLCANIVYFGYGHTCNDTCDTCKIINEVMWENEKEI